MLGFNIVAQDYQPLINPKKAIVSFWNLKVELQRRSRETAFFWFLTDPQKLPPGVNCSGIVMQDCSSDHAVASDNCIMDMVVTITARYRSRWLAECWLPSPDHFQLSYNVRTQVHDVRGHHDTMSWLVSDINIVTPPIVTQTHTSRSSREKILPIPRHTFLN